MPGFGPGPGGPMGPMGPMGGPMGGFGAYGPAAGHAMHNYAYPHLKPMPNRNGGPVRSTGNPLLDILNGLEDLRYECRICRFHGKGRFKSITGGLKYHFSGKMKLETMNAVIEEEQQNIKKIQEQVGKREITEAESLRLIRQCKVRQMSAAREYYDLLYKTGFIELDERNKSMEEFCAGLGFDYVAPTEEREVGRTRGR